MENGGDASEDILVDTHTQLDFSAQQRLTDDLTLLLELINLTDEPLRLFEGTPDRPIQEEYYSWWGLVSIRWSR